MYYALLILTALVLTGSFVFAFYKTKDAFHPMVLLAPMFMVMYVYLPLSLESGGLVHRYLTNEQQVYVQLLTVCSVTTFCIGCLQSLRKRGHGLSKIFRLPDYSRKRMFWCAISLGLVGGISWLFTILNTGGFLAAYGRAYGGGDSSYGYLRDAVYLTIPALVLLVTSYLGRKVNVRLVLTCIVLVIPLLTQGILGARRGPTFMVLVSIAVSWFMVRFKRPPLVYLLLGGLGVGLLMLMIVTNRHNMYLGSDWNMTRDPSQYLKAQVGNEYIYGSGAVINAASRQDYYWGRRYLTVLFIRPIPSAWWPTKYEDVGMERIKTNLGVGTDEFQSSVGWRGAVGAAPGIIADMFVEFSWLAIFVLYLIGFGFGEVWRRACFVGGFAIAAYIILVSLSVYIVFQGLEPLLVRFLFMSGPSYLLWRWALVKPNQQEAIFTRKPITSFPRRSFPEPRSNRP